MIIEAMNDLLEAGEGNLQTLSKMIVMLDERGGKLGDDFELCVFVKSALAQCGLVRSHDPLTS